jgi:hypothetical protein
MSSIPADAFTLHGGCDCTAIRYTISVPTLPSRPILPGKDISGAELRPPQIFFDHCNKCRRVSGALVQAWFTCPQDWVEWSIATENPSIPAEEPARETFATKDVVHSKLGSTLAVNYASSPEVTRSFCGRCGTNLLYVFEGREKTDSIPMIDLVLGSLDAESLEMEGVRPDRHFYWESGIGWVKNLVTEGDSSLSGKQLPRHPDGSRLQVV